jgi:hypothetical protein
VCEIVIRVTRLVGSYRLGITARANNRLVGCRFSGVSEMRDGNHILRFGSGVVAR